MTQQQNKNLVRGYMEECFNPGDISQIPKYFPAGPVTFGGRTVPPQMIINYWRQSFADFHIQIDDQIAEDDKVVTRVTLSGTHTGEYKGFAATNKRFSSMGITIDRIAAGKVVEMWHETNELAILRQLGIDPKGS